MNRKRRTPLALLTAQQFASDCLQKGLPIPVEHTLWILKKRLIPPIAKLHGVSYYNEFQIYSLDLIEDRRLQSLKYPKAPGVTRAGKKLRFYSPEITWQEYLILNKDAILHNSKEWVPLAQLLSEIQVLHNTFLYKALKTKSDLERMAADGEKEPIDPAFDALIEREGRAEAESILSKYPNFSEDILRYWKNNVLTYRMARHNPLVRLASRYPDWLDIFAKEGGRFFSNSTTGNPIGLSNFYWQMIFYLNFFVSCLTKGKEPDIREIFSPRGAGKICLICKTFFLPNSLRKGGRMQKLCGKKKCDGESRKARAVTYRKRKKAAGA
jgi:hypothetical protein